MRAEAWRPCPGYEGLYEVSDAGRVRSLHKRFSEPRLCKFGTDETGYPIVMLSKDGTRKPFTVHRLVALAFHGDKRNVLHREVAHLDNDKTNARADNLQWVSRIENESHKRIHGTAPIGEKSGTATLTNAQATEVIALLMTRVPTQEIARRFGVTYSVVDGIRRGKTWRHIPRPEGFHRRRISISQPKLTFAQAAKVRAARGSMTCREAERLFGVSRSLVSRIWTGKAYRPERTLNVQPHP